LNSSKMKINLLCLSLKIILLLSLINLKRNINKRDWFEFLGRLNN
jgi:hypothetical protein